MRGGVCARTGVHAGPDDELSHLAEHDDSDHHNRHGARDRQGWPQPRHRRAHRYPASWRRLRRIAPVNAGSSRIVISRARSMQSVTSSATCRAADGVASRRMIRVSPSSAGSMASATACSTWRRTWSRSRSTCVPRAGSYRSWPSRAVTSQSPQPPEGPRWPPPRGALPRLGSPAWPKRPGLATDCRSTAGPALPAAGPATLATPGPPPRAPARGALSAQRRVGQIRVGTRSARPWRNAAAPNETGSRATGAGGPVPCHRRAAGARRCAWPRTSPAPHPPRWSRPALRAKPADEAAVVVAIHGRAGMVRIPLHGDRSKCDVR
jgi:hypothetical protein